MNGRLRVEGLKEATKQLDMVGLRARRPEPALRAPGTLEDLIGSERRRFSKQSGWKKDTPRWIAEKRKRGLDQKTLRATGALERALTSGESPVKFSAWNSTLTWGIPGGRTDLYYAAPLAKGWQAGKTAVKGRKMVVIDRMARLSISVRVELYVTSGEIR